MSDAVVVGVRVRPFNEREKLLGAELCIEMSGPTTSIKDPKGKIYPYAFDESLWSHDGFETDTNGYCYAQPDSKYADQRYVYECFGQKVLDNAWQGFHCCLFAYGQTGAGKSYSMIGYGANRGIVPISCEEIFNRMALNDSPDITFEVTVSVIEIYNERIQDLLVLPDDRPFKGLDIRESKLLGVYIDGVTKKAVDTYEDIEEVIEEAMSHRTVGSTQMNATSSRAHTVQTIEFKQVERQQGVTTCRVSMINLVDLAGSEKASQTGASGDRLKEGCAINQSLTALGNVIEKLAEVSTMSEKKRALISIPYRNSKLTRLLQNALGGSSKTIMICALSPASSNYEETLSTLRYADRAKKIKNNAVVNENPQDKLLRELREENEKLKLLVSEASDPWSGLGENDVVAKRVSIREMEDEIAEARKALENMQKSFAEKLRESKAFDRIKTMRRNSLLNIGSLPSMVNLSEDPNLCGKLKFYFREGTSVIGRSPIHRIRSNSSSRSTCSHCETNCPVSPSRSSSSASDSNEESREFSDVDIALIADNVKPRHGIVENVQGICYLSAYWDAFDLTFLNGYTLRVALNQQNILNQGEAHMITSKRRHTVHRRRSKSPATLPPHRHDPGGSSENESFEDSFEGEGRDDQRGISESILLSHGDRLIFSKIPFFFVDPTRGAAEMMLLRNEVSFSMAKKELFKNSGIRLRGTADLPPSSNTKKALLAELAEKTNELQKLKGTLQSPQITLMGSFDLQSPFDGNFPGSQMVSPISGIQLQKGSRGMPGRLVALRHKWNSQMDSAQELSKSVVSKWMLYATRAEEACERNQHRLSCEAEDPHSAPSARSVRKAKLRILRSFEEDLSSLESITRPQLAEILPKALIR